MTCCDDQDYAWRPRTGTRTSVSARGKLSDNFWLRRAITPAAAACTLQPRREAYFTAPMVDV
ncbi:MAG TPA: hypothetical protein VJ734_01215 [Nitrosospira sp.]|nr:hypothetical protein [Nitrosospira sp.]